MRGTRVDKNENGRYLIIHFGHFGKGLPSQELNLSEKDFVNLYAQMERILCQKDDK